MSGALRDDIQYAHHHVKGASTAASRFIWNPGHIFLAMCPPFPMQVTRRVGSATSFGTIGQFAAVYCESAHNSHAKKNV